MSHSGYRLLALAGWLSLIAQAHADHLSPDADPPVSRTLQSPLWDNPPGADTATISSATPTPLCLGSYPSGPTCPVNPFCHVPPPPCVPPTSCGGSGGGSGGPVTAGAAPEPSSLALTLLGAAGLGWTWRKRRT
jgi:hypothetical protein